MNCIFICVFNNVEYVRMLYLLLESIFLYGNLAEDIEILIYTSSAFVELIKQNPLFRPCIKFEVNDTYNSVDSACKSRLDLFSLASNSNYDKIIYLDTDIIVSGDMHSIFALAQDEVLYAVEEGKMDAEEEYWGAACSILTATT